MEFAVLVEIPEDNQLKLSQGWLEHFKARNGLKQMKGHGEAASAEAETVEHEWKQIQALIQKYGYKLRNIFNMDETGLFYGYESATPMLYLNLTPLKP